MSGGSSGGGGMSIGSGITAGVSSIANIGAGWFADKQLAKGTAESMQRQNQANKLYTNLYDQTQAGYGGFTAGGDSAFSALLRSYGIGTQNGTPDYSGFENSPDYQFAMQQGEKALARKQSAQGNRLSPGAVMELMQFNSGLASQNLGRYRSGLADISGMGLSANNALAQYRMGYGQQEGTGITNLGDLAMARRLGRANINYRNVAAQDSIFGSMFGGAAQHPDQSSNSRGSTYPSNDLSTSYQGGSTFDMGSNWWG